MNIRRLIAGILGTPKQHNPGRRRFAGQLAGTAAAGAALGASAAQALPASGGADPWGVPADQLPVVLNTEAGARGWCKLVSHPGLRVTVDGKPFAATFVDIGAKVVEGSFLKGTELEGIQDDDGYPPEVIAALLRSKTSATVKGLRLRAGEEFQTIEAAGVQFATNLFRTQAGLTPPHKIAAEYAGCIVTRTTRKTASGYRQRFQIQSAASASGVVRYDDETNATAIELEPGASVETGWTEGPLSWPTLTAENEPSGWGAQIEEWSRTICDRSTVEALDNAADAASPYKSQGEAVVMSFDSPGGEVRGAIDCSTFDALQTIRNAAVRVYIYGQPAAEWLEGMAASERRYWLEGQPAAVDCSPTDKKPAVKWRGPKTPERLRMVDPVRKYNRAVAAHIEAGELPRDEYRMPRPYQHDLLSLIDHDAEPPEPFVVEPGAVGTVVLTGRRGIPDGFEDSSAFAGINTDGSYTGIRPARQPVRAHFDFTDTDDPEAAFRGIRADSPPTKHEDATLVPSRFDNDGRMLFDDDDKAGTVQKFREANRRDFAAIDGQLGSWADDVRELGTALDTLKNGGKA